MIVNEVRIWRKQPTKRNPDFLVVGFIVDAQDLGTWNRSGKHKGFDTNHIIARRPMTDGEIETESKSYRLHFHRYQSWKGLILDEYLVTSNLKWTQELTTISRQNIPLIDIITEALRKP